jgi:shikimate dehydrogenase
MKIYGLIGRNISYSFSKKYFSEKFEKENIAAEYRNFDLEDLNQLKTIIRENPGISGFNVTIPYKELIIPYLDNLDPVAREIGAVNTIKIEDDGKLTGYNTDHYGFVNSIKPLLDNNHSHALILGTGGASKAVAYGLSQMGIRYKFVSRTAQEGWLDYGSLGHEEFTKYTLIINCTPLGTFPDITAVPPIPTTHFTARHVIFDLIYNPPVTHLMQIAQAKGARVKNGYQMLELQAQKSWEIWNAGKIHNL